MYTIIEALADGSVKQGVPRQMAIQFAAQTVLGAAKTVIQTGKHPAVLRDEVSTVLLFKYFHFIFEIRTHMALTSLYYLLLTMIRLKIRGIGCLKYLLMVLLPYILI